MLGVAGSADVFTFEVLPLDAEPLFEPFLLDVPTMLGEDHSARRAWWSAFHMLGRLGVEPESFEVRRYGGATGEGRRVHSSGYVADGAA